MKSVPTRCFFSSVFSRICTGYRDLQSKSPYIFQIRENVDQKKLLIGTFLTQFNIITCLSQARFVKHFHKSNPIIPQYNINWQNHPTHICKSPTILVNLISSSCNGFVSRPKTNADTLQVLLSEPQPSTGNIEQGEGAFF